MHRLKAMKECLVECVECEMKDLAKANTHELGEAIDMIKDLEEAMYYCAKIKRIEAEGPRKCTCGHMMHEEDEHEDGAETETHHHLHHHMEPKEMKIGDLEKHISEMTKNISKIIEGASTEDLTILRQRLVALIEKIK